MTWLWVVLVVVIIGLTAAVAAGRGGAMARAYPDRREVRLPAGRPMTAADLSKVRFSVVLRGYRMDEVDEVIEHLARELAARDARIAALERSLASEEGNTRRGWDVSGSQRPGRAEPVDRPRPHQAHPYQPADGAPRPVEPTSQSPATWRTGTGGRTDTGDRAGWTSGSDRS
ncbi:DivIVA domain-containing protein [Thermasporomyces composti]|jgi:DivIVA domain-containing protein|uniref:DivIVA domain-containing protein n=1 Tax=Thermasporomyces composti TaxID=696763 RepID=A0A3D9V265_THECX|nr:DivIVA domain-containing protein [Thermasporomyces composti]REF35569.1 DivIVA domain-containing protein [Thermasporomyces composti]